MSLSTLLRRTLLSRLLKEFPMLSASLSWLTDPTQKGRKRTLALLILGAGTVASALSPFLTSLCTSPSPALHGWVCTAAGSDIGTFLTALGNFIGTLAPDAQGVGILVGLWGLLDAWRKHKLGKQAPDPALLQGPAAAPTSSTFPPKENN